MVFLSKFRSCWNLWKVLVALWDYHGVEIVYGHCRVVCVEVKTHKIWCFSSFSSFFFQKFHQKWLLGRAGSPVGAPAAAKDGQVALQGEELWADWVLISSGVIYEECKILF